MEPRADIEVVVPEYVLQRAQAMQITCVEVLLVIVVALVIAAFVTRRRLWPKAN
jgi:hypothetical protein